MSERTSWIITFLAVLVAVTVAGVLVAAGPLAGIPGTGKTTSAAAPSTGQENRP